MYIQWSPLFEVGVPLIDEQHRRLFGIVNLFHEAYAGGNGHDRVYGVLNQLVRYVEEHFQSEETLMEQARYPDLARQRREHDTLARRIFELTEEHEAGSLEVSGEVMKFLKRWLLDHILHQDKKLEDFFRAREIPKPWDRPQGE
jgi:hemerythrin